VLVNGKAWSEWISARSFGCATMPPCEAPATAGFDRAPDQGVARRPARGWTVADLAAEAGMSRSAFCARFRRVVGLPPMRYARTICCGLARTGVFHPNCLRVICGSAGSKVSDFFVQDQLKSCE